MCPLAPCQQNPQEALPEKCIHNPPCSPECTLINLFTCHSRRSGANNLKINNITDESVALSAVKVCQ